MRNPPAGFQTAIASETVRIAEIYDFELQSGELFYFTTHTKSLTWNSNTYTTLPLERGDIGYKLNLEADSTRVSMGGISGGFVSLLQANAVDNVTLTVRTVIWDDTSDPLMAMIEFQGTGDVDFDRREVHFTFKSILDNLNIAVPKNLYQEQCNNRLYDTQCGLTQADYKYSGSVPYLAPIKDVGDVYSVPFDGGGSSSLAAIEAGDSLAQVIASSGIDPVFSGDAACKALYRFESLVGLVTDDIGTNTLTNYLGNVNVDLINKYEGDGASLHAGSNDYLFVDDTDLDAGFPTKSGGTNDITMVFRFRRTSSSNSWPLLKYTTAGSLRSWRVFIPSAGNYVDFAIGHTGGTLIETGAQHLVTITNDVWYSIGITYENSSKNWRIRVKNEDTDVTTETTGTFTNNMSLTAARLEIGGDLFTMFGNVDEVSFFDDVKNASEIDAIIGHPLSIPSTAICAKIEYDTATTGTVWFYDEIVGTDAFANNDDVENGEGDQVTFNGTPAIDSTYYDDGGPAEYGRFVLTDIVRGSTYKVGFDGGDVDNPIVIGDDLSINFIGGPSGGGNDFEDDLACRALYRFESGGLLTDSIGTNTLTNNGGVSEDAVTFFEGLGSGLFDGGGDDYLSITDYDLDSRFPFKSGENNRDFTICFRARDDDSWEGRILIQKKSSFEIYMSSSRVRFRAYFDGGSWENGNHFQTTDINKWYSVAVTYTDATKAWKIRVKDETTGIITETTGNFADYIDMTTGEFWIGDDDFRDDWMDEVVVFNDVKTAAEIDAIFAQEYPGERGSGVCVDIVYTDAASGVLWYVEQAGLQFIDNDVLTANRIIPGGNNITVDGTPAEDTTFYEVSEIEMTSGLNNGFRRMAVTQSGDDTTIVNAFPNNILEGDAYDIYPGCGQSSAVCLERFDNEVNYTGHLYVPKPEEAMT